MTIGTFDLWDGSLPEFGPAAAAAKMAVFAGQAPTGDQAAAWKAAERTFRRLAGAEYYLFSVPMWNHGIPYILKQFTDVVSQPGMVFAFDAEHGYTGLLTGKRAVVVYTSAVYGAGRPAAFGSDFQARTSTTGGVGRYHRHHRNPLPARPRHRRRRHGRQAVHAAAREAAKKF